MTPQPIEPEETETEGTRRSRDPELRAIEQMIRLLEDLDPLAQLDAMNYLNRRVNRGAAVQVRETSP